MNYIEQLNAFFIKKEQDALSSRAQCLYFNLLGLEMASYRWAAWFSGFRPAFAGDRAGLSRNQLTQARAELMQKGYLCYETGRGSQTRAGITWRILRPCTGTNLGRRAVRERRHKQRRNRSAARPPF